MKIAIEFNLRDATIVAHWPWGPHAFPSTSEGHANLAEALQLFAIECTRRLPRDPQVIPAEQLRAIRAIVESGPRVATRYVPGSSGKKEVPPLDELFSPDDDLSMYFGEGEGSSSHG